MRCLATGVLSVALAWGIAVGGAPTTDASNYSEAHPPVGQQPRRPANYVPFHYSKSPQDLLREETPAFLERAQAAWSDTQAVIEQGPYRPTRESLGTHPCPEWFLDAKFGMFIDWGPWSVAGWAPQQEKATYPDWYEQRLLKEYRDYHLKVWGADIQPDDLIQLMRSDEFRTERFTELVQAAGMRYVVPFLKHHGGYCLWQSSFTHRNSVEWGLKRDVARELAVACRAAKLRYGIYVSLGEWNYPVLKDGALWTVSLNMWTDRNQGAPRDRLTASTPFVSGKIPVKNYARDYLVPSLKELIDHTDPDMLWFDGEWEAPATAWCSPDLSAYFYNRAAQRGQEVCINDRLGIQTRGQPGWGDFYTSEFHVITGLQTHPWEENRSLSHSYGYNWEESFDDRYVLTEAAALDMLFGIVANGGNLLLMVSPDGSGRVPPNQERRLRFLGHWLERNGQAIYATRPVGLVKQPAWGYLTRSKKNDRLYLIVRHWPADGHLTVPVEVRVKQAVLPGAPERELKSTSVPGQGFMVDLQGCAAPDPLASVIEVEVAGEIKPLNSSVPSR